ncbi:MAG: hypothetical protein ACTSVY_15990 [Candidatus Helarchaeota archaeon]
MFNILINKMNQVGSEIIASHPSNFFTDEENAIIAMKSFPLNAKAGEFSTFLLKENIVTASYVFTIKEIEGFRPSWN